jgi:hypothetical protein
MSRRPSEGTLAFLSLLALPFLAAGGLYFIVNYPALAILALVIYLFTSR